ncbi:DUF1127 domain-containing protein [Roseovarius spongiae]|uniref:DUF1127 domain-containing protein n=1 Tax=Roseovarius spongiae TaxID=2320272 RepID=A0A3A8B4M6_9RHOB|nr:DUF1127 domain-containing protein [Roseovarius spongiae]RKF13497.1 DUF1127 domain-containing protein [Roseovarius spongiae]
MIIASNALIRRSGHANGAAALIGNVAQAVARRRAYRKTVNELSQLTARELADLGLSRGNIRATAYDSVYGTRQEA